VTPTYVLLDVTGLAFMGVGLSAILRVDWLPEPFRSESVRIAGFAVGSAFMVAPALLFVRRKRERATRHPQSR